MEEYFCPNCGAVLNEQYRFDPDDGTWTCTICGKLLMDEDTFEGDKYEGVAWFCDECGALMNKQNGFHDYYDSWTCTECYHTNRISEDEIYESEEAYQERRVVDENENDDKEYDEEEDENENDFSTSNYFKVDSSTLSSVYDNYSQNPSKGSIFFKRMKAILFNKKGIEIGVSNSEVVGKNINYVQTKLLNKGFKNIKAIPVKDIYIGTNKTVGEVGQVVINGNSWFGKNALIPYDAEILITYHVKHEIEFPFSPKDVRKKNYIEIVQQLISLGFTQVYIKENAVLVTGWISKDGSIEKMTVKNEESYKEGIMYDYDVDIKINYYTFPKKKN